MKRNAFTFTAGAIALTLAAPTWVAYAQGEPPAEPMQQQSQDQMAPLGGQLMQMTANDLKGKKVVNNEGKELGKIEKIVQGQQDNQIYAVISVGGFLGIGEKSVALPINEMQLQDERILLTTGLSEDQLEQQANAYQAENYVEVGPDQQLAEVAASGVRLSFEQIDQNGDGYISRDEAPEDLTSNWQQADQNADDQLDQAEFSAFEQQRMQMEEPSEMQPQAPQPSDTQQQSPGGAGY